MSILVGCSFTVIRLVGPLKARIEALEARITEEGREEMGTRKTEIGASRAPSGPWRRRSSCGCSTPVSDPAPAVLVRNRQTRSGGPGV